MVPASYDSVFAVLEQLTTYPAWWPEVRRIEPVNDTTADVTIRAFLPYSLRFRMELKQLDNEKGVLEASLAGDLDGFSSWTVTPIEGGCRLGFEEEVRVNKVLLQLLAPLARPLFKLNHAVMMRRGERGLRKFVAGVN